MAAWSPPPIDAAALKALTVIETPSRPEPLPDSRRVGHASWATKRSREEVIAAYSKPSAPVPKGSRVAVEHGVLVIRAPFSTSALLFSRAPEGCVYSLMAGATLTITGKGVPSGEFAVACGIDDVNVNTGKPQRSLMATFKEGEQDWLLWVSENEEGVRGKGKAILEAVDLATAFGDDSTLEGRAVAAQIGERDGRFTASFKKGNANVTVEATRTHSLCALVQTFDVQRPQLDPSHRLMCVSKASSGPMDQRITGVGGVAGGKPWRLDTATLIARIEAGEQFHVFADDDEDDAVRVTIATGTSGTKYPLAKLEGDRRNHVVGLPKCRKVTNPVAPP